VVFLVFPRRRVHCRRSDRSAPHRNRRPGRKLDRRETLVIPVSCAAFALGGAFENMQEEIIAFVPLLLLPTRRLGFDALTAVAMPGAAAVAASFSPINLFQAQIAQKLHSCPLGQMGVPHHPDAVGARLLTGRDPACAGPKASRGRRAGSRNITGWRTPLILLSVLGRSQFSLRNPETGMGVRSAVRSLSSWESLRDSWAGLVFEGPSTHSSKASDP
jgi:hypothetical protein